MMSDMHWMFAVVYEMPDGSKWMKLPDGKHLVEVLDEDGITERFGVRLETAEEALARAQAASPEGDGQHAGETP